MKKTRGVFKNMPPTAIRVKEREAFGRFCLSLSKAGWLFNLAGSQTVILPEEIPVMSPKELAKYPTEGPIALLNEFRNANLVTEYSVPSRGQRHLPTPDKAKVLLKEFSQNLRGRKFPSKRDS